MASLRRVSATSPSSAAKVVIATSRCGVRSEADSAPGTENILLAGHREYLDCPAEPAWRRSRREQRALHFVSFMNTVSLSMSRPSSGKGKRGATG